MNRIGWWGTWSEKDYFTNEVLVGPTNESDIGYTFIDPTPNDPFEEGYDYGELVKMNTSASQNYDLWWLAIFETGPTNHRYRTMGWTYGTVPNDEIDLTDFWNGPNNTWEFETFHQYTVQFVVENSKCRNGIEFPNPNGWNNLNRSFFICPAGAGCRFGTGGREITISPNPAGSVIHLENFEPDLDRDYRLTIADMSSKIVRSIPLTTDRVDISDLESGMFIVSIFREGEQVFSSKLVVNR
ncbi:MAG: T9SS C-terminal target domain-containing protein [Bacteroidetes bacterium]|nr:MAG: T9SS C-terminal target domain-containing protein [Bacteroidota bacterium]